MRRRFPLIAVSLAVLWTVIGSLASWPKVLHMYFPALRGPSETSFKFKCIGSRVFSLVFDFLDVSTREGRNNCTWGRLFPQSAAASGIGSAAFSSPTRHRGLCPFPKLKLDYCLFVESWLPPHLPIVSFTNRVLALLTTVVDFADKRAARWSIGGCAVRYVPLLVGSNSTRLRSASWPECLTTRRCFYLLVALPPTRCVPLIFWPRCGASGLSAP